MQNKLKQFEIMPPQVQAMILAASEAKVAQIAGDGSLKQQANNLIEKLAGESKYLHEAYLLQIEPDNLRDNNPLHIAKFQELKAEAIGKAKDAIAAEVLHEPQKFLEKLNKDFANNAHSPAEIAKMAKIVKLIGASKIEPLAIGKAETEQNGGASKTLGASLAMSLGVETQPKLPRKEKNAEIG